MYSLIVPLLVMLPIALCVSSVNYIAPHPCLI